MKRPAYFFLFLFSFYCTINLAQNAKTLDRPLSEIEIIDAKIQKYKLLAHSDPKEGTKKLIEVRNYCVKINHKDGAMKSSMGLVLIYYNDGDYKKTIEESRFVEKYAKELQHHEYLSDAHRMRSNAYGEMGLIKECLEELGKAIPYADRIKKTDSQFYKKALIYESYAGIYDKKGDANKQLYYRQKSIAESNKMLGEHPVVVNAKYQNLAYQYASMGYIYSNLKVTDSANYYFEKALEITENNQYEIYTNVRATLLSDMAKFCDFNKAHQKAILFAKRAEGFEKQAPMPYIRRDIYHSLFSSYVETVKKDSSKYYLKLYTSLNDSLLKQEKENILTPVNQIISDKEIENKTTLWNVLIVSAVMLIIFILIGWIYWKRKNKFIHTKYEALIARIKNEKERENTLPESQKITESGIVKSSVNITEETAKALLLKLEKFEVSDKYLSKGINKTWLANKLNTNARYLSEVIKIHSGKTFSDYINGLRINYITYKLVEYPLYREYKINYLAEECGYASSQVFVISFKKETGLTPSYFIEKLKEDSEIEVSVV